jgi:hypothetical protein
MILSDLIDRMVAAGLSPGEAGSIAAEIYAAGVASASVRSPGAERTRRWRHKASQNVTKRHADETSPSVTERHQASQCDDSTVSPIDTNIKKGKRQNSERASRGTRIDPTWSPSDADRSLGREEGFSDTEINREALRFRDYWSGRAGSGGVKLDWAATWRNWIRTSGEKLGKTPKAPGNGGEAVGSGFLAKAGSNELEAWDAFGKREKGKSFPRDRNGDWRFPARWPPGYVPAAPQATVAPPALAPLRRMDA